MGALYPLIFEPIFKERVWGGRELQRLYAKTLPPSAPVGESWEISDRAGDASLIANGPLAGRDLHWLMDNHAQDLLGRAKPANGHFPLLIKILDAAEKLSLQVHPPAHKVLELGGEPKTELWYVVHAVPGAELYVGLRSGCTREEFTRRIHNGTVAECFHRVRVRPGDAMFLPSGRVHAIGAGMVIYEIQQNSDTTYRVFDWNRLGLDGKARELHLREALESIDFNDIEPDLVRPQPREDFQQVNSLVRDPLFTVDQAKLVPGGQLPLVDGAMQILGIVAGQLQIKSQHTALMLSEGQFCVVPACVKAVGIAQTAVTFLWIRAGEG
jgi:mannose-6-phosphate isomerase